MPAHADDRRRMREFMENSRIGWVYGESNQHTLTSEMLGETPIDIQCVLQRGDSCRLRGFEMRGTSKEVVLRSLQSRLCATIGCQKTMEACWTDLCPPS